MINNDSLELVKEAVSKNGRLLEYASERLKDDKDVVLAAVSQNGNALKYASERLKDELLTTCSG